MYNNICLGMCSLVVIQVCTCHRSTFASSFAYSSPLREARSKRSMTGLLGSLAVVRQKQKKKIKNPSVYFENPANYKSQENAQEIRRVHGWVSSVIWLHWFTPRPPGGDSHIKKMGVLVGNFEKNILRGTKIPFCGPGLKFPPSPLEVPEAHHSTF